MSAKLDEIFCCANAKPYPRPIKIDKDHIFVRFISAAGQMKSSIDLQKGEHDASMCSRILSAQGTFVVQLVRQINYGPIESTRYFVEDPTAPRTIQPHYIELMEKDLLEANYTKVNSYKNYRCTDHDRFFEMNLYQKDPVNLHHWRINAARPAKEIDL